MKCLLGSSLMAKTKKKVERRGDWWWSSSGSVGAEAWGRGGWIGLRPEEGKGKGVSGGVAGAGVSAKCYQVLF